MKDCTVQIMACFSFQLNLQSLDETIDVKSNCSVAELRSICGSAEINVIHEVQLPDYTLDGIKPLITSISTFRCICC